MSKSLFTPSYDCFRLLLAQARRSKKMTQAQLALKLGKPQSFVYDIADIFKFETVVPVAFRIAAKNPANPERDVRLACRDAFRQSKVLERIIPTIEQVLAAGGLQMPKAPVESVEIAIPNKEAIGDDGHRG